MLDLSGVPMLDVVIGLAFMYFLLSVVCSAIGEAIASVFRLRARTLETGVRSLLGNPGRARDFFDNWLVKPLWKPGAGPLADRKPSYIPPRTAALALIDSLNPALAAPAQQTDPPQSPSQNLRDDAERLIEGITATCAHDGLTQMVQSAEHGIDVKRAAIERIFNDVMDRASGWYKRRMQAILFVVALLVAIGLNADTFNVADRLARDDALRARVVVQAEEAAKKPSPDPGTTPEEVQKRITEARATALPLGWGGENRPVDGTLKNWLLKVGGWLVTAFALALGAPFWFDLLGRFANLRGTGNRIGTPKDDDLAPTDRDARPVRR